MVLLNQATNTMTTVVVEEDEGVGSAGKIMTSRSVTETLLSIFGQTGR